MDTYISEKDAKNFIRHACRGANRPMNMWTDTRYGSDAVCWIEDDNTLYCHTNGMYLYTVYYSRVRLTHQVHKSSSQDFWSNFAYFFCQISAKFPDLMS